MRTCEHGYMDRQRCALCRRAVEALHDPRGVYAEEPEWKRLEREAARSAVPMPDHVRAMLERLRAGLPLAEDEAPAYVQQQMVP